jgi:hypothetical protein
MATGGGDLDAPARRRLAAHIGEVESLEPRRGRRTRAQLRLVDDRRLFGRRLARDDGNALAQRPNCHDLDVVDQLCLREVRLGDDDPLDAEVGGREDRGQHPGDRANSAVEGELAEDHRRAEPIARQLPVRSQEGECDREVVVRARLRKVWESAYLRSR